jgi:hypothetical protein
MPPLGILVGKIYMASDTVGIGLSYRPASLCSLATQFQTRFLESIPRPTAGPRFSSQKVNNEMTSAALIIRARNRSTTLNR